MTDKVYKTIREALGVELGAGRDFHIEPYAPFGDLAPDFYSVRNKDSAVNNFVAYCPPRWSRAFLWPLPDTGRRPGHGLFLIPHLSADSSTKGLDLGCGQSMFLGMQLHHLGAGSVTGLDKVPPGESLGSWLDEKTRYVQGDILDETVLGGDMFDVAITHPPMAPTENQEGKRTNTDHDVAGPTGREVLDFIISHWTKKLRPGGELVIGQFDFLGVMAAHGDPPCTAEVLGEAGLAIEQVHTYHVPITPTIKNALGLIRSVYPKYPFEKRGDTTYHQFSVINARKNK